MVSRGCDVPGWWWVLPRSCAGRRIVESVAAGAGRFGCPFVSFIGTHGLDWGRSCVISSTTTITHLVAVAVVSTPMKGLCG